MSPFFATLERRVCAFKLMLFCAAVVITLLFMLSTAATPPVFAQSVPPAHPSHIAPNSLGLVSFDAEQKKKAVVLNWETGTEIDLLGFYVWRRYGDNEPKRLNTDMIPVLNPGEIIGNTYSLKDRAVRRNRTYYYQLEVVGADGYSAWTEEIQVNVK